MNEQITRDDLMNFDDIAKYTHLERRTIVERHSKRANYPRPKIKASPSKQFWLKDDIISYYAGEKKSQQ